MQYLKRYIITVVILALAFDLQSQNNLIGNLKQKLLTAKNDSIQAYTLDSLSMYYMFYTEKHDSSYYYIRQSVNNGFTVTMNKDYAVVNIKFLILAYARMAFYYLNTSQLKAGLDIAYKGLQLAEQNYVHDYTSTLYYDISFIYYNLGDSVSAIQNAFKGIEALRYNKDPFYDIPLHLYGLISSIYTDGNNSVLALKYLHLTDSAANISRERAAKDIDYYYWTGYYLNVENYLKADSVIKLGIASCKKNGDFLMKVFYLFQSISYYNRGMYKEAINAGRLGIDLMDRGGAASAQSYIQKSYYKLGKIDSAYFYLKASDSLGTIVQNQSNINETQQVQFSQQLAKKEADANSAMKNEKSRSKIMLYVFLGALLFFLLLAFFQWRNSVHRKRTNALLQIEKEKVEHALTELKATQAQLIQSEKMASLGELTAGIAHEIQNPLNFVNNFSEVNKEMIVEMKDEIDKGNYDEVKIIANDIADNEAKINHHGKRADAIVKGMLQHSRSGTGAKEPANINALCDEYLRLAYNGLRAKKKDFNADLKTDFDPDLSSVKARINIVPQDIGRVLLNLYNNAFYAVSERKKVLAVSYEPLVSVATKKTGDKIEISVRDNGSGIPQDIADKIFQPFFTTKPAGKGTGLGLSLSYDIIKAHGGEINVESAKDEGTTFRIKLPSN